MMVSFDVGDSQKFNLRAACLIMKDDKVLFQRFHNSDWWFLPGGRIEMMEESGQAIERELREEYGWSVKDKKLVWIVENFFRLDDRDFHELGLYYHVQFDGEIEATDEDFPGLENISVSRWIHVDDLDRYNIVPAFLKQEIKELPSSSAREVKHLVYRG
jgi:8-oxo-dGTP pyrophosphatase MutT (NUDIX family)